MDDCTRQIRYFGIFIHALHNNHIGPRVQSDHNLNTMELNSQLCVIQPSERQVLCYIYYSYAAVIDWITSDELTSSVQLFNLNFGR